MSEIVLFHSTLGLRPAILDAAERLRALGHRVHAPDVFDGETFTTIDAGLAKRDAVGIPELLRRWGAAVEGLPPGRLYVGWSLGCAAAASLAATKPGCKGVALLHGAPTLQRLGLRAWPRDVAVQVQRAERDPWVGAEEVAALRRDVEAAGAPFTQHLHPGEVHLFDDPGLPGHDPVAAASLWTALVDWVRAQG